MSQNFRTDRTLFRYSPIMGELLGQWTDERNTGSREACTLQAFLAEAAKKHDLPGHVVETLRRRILTYEAVHPGTR